MLMYIQSPQFGPLAAVAFRIWSDGEPSSHKKQSRVHVVNPDCAFSLLQIFQKGTLL